MSGYYMSNSNLLVQDLIYIIWPIRRLQRKEARERCDHRYRRDGFYRRCGFIFGGDTGMHNQRRPSESVQKA